MGGLVEREAGPREVTIEEEGTPGARTSRGGNRQCRLSLPPSARSGSGGNKWGGLDQRQVATCRHRFLESVALFFQELFCLTSCMLVVLFDALGCGRQTKTTREPQDSPNDHQALPILDHTINKPAINLDLVEIQCLQLCKRRIPGPEIVEGDSNSRLPQFVDHSLRHVDIFYKRALGTTLIPNVVYTIIWAGRLQRHRAIWEELQFRLQLTDHPNAISVLFRVLFELSIENYIERTNLSSVIQMTS